MKHFPTLFTVFIFCCILSYAQNPGEWVWKHGSNTTGSAGSFGTQGVASASNEPPALYEVCEWTDLNGNFWMYGGLDQSTNNCRSVLWKYDPGINQWTWMTGSNILNYGGNYGTQGISAPTNLPPAKTGGAESWVDLAGDLWMFGGYNNGCNCFYSDLWKYSIATNEWTWMKGPNVPNQAGTYGTIGVPNIANNPGSRWETAAAWTDNSGDLWFFGGIDRLAAYYNDLWRYNISTNTWTWMKGPQLTNQAGVYGIKGVEDSLNIPGARGAYARWKDSAGNFWMFGGMGPIHVSKSDLWRYNPVTNNWTWMHGSMATINQGLYGTKCSSNPSVNPGQRYENRATWTDACGNFWMFGGGINFLGDAYNGLWEYSVANNQWKWVNGDSVSTSTGNWGTKGVSSPANKLNGRIGSVAWVDKNHLLYLFGGSSIWATIYNDLWAYKIDTTCVPCQSSSKPQSSFSPTDTIFCGETTKCLDFVDHSSGNPTSWHWFFPGAFPDSSLLQNPTQICYSNIGTYPVTLIVTNSAGTDTLTISPMITFSAGPAIPLISKNSDTLICTNAFHYQWYLDGLQISGATDSFYIAASYGTYAVEITDSLGCRTISSGLLITTVNNLDALSGIKIFPNPAGDWIKIYCDQFTNCITVEIFTVTGQKLYSEPFTKQPTISTKQLPEGIYFLKITSEKGSVNKRIIVER